MKTLLISDIHLGSPDSLALETRLLLETETFDRLILLGDIFSDLNFARLCKQQWKLLSLIRKLSNSKRGVEVVWVEGNHDTGLINLMTHLVGVPVYQEYEWEQNGVKMLAIHGHQFDKFLSDKGLGRLLNWVYLEFQHVAWFRSLSTKIVNHVHLEWQRIGRAVADGAFHLAQERGAGTVFCGHTHEPVYAEYKGISYYNTGCCVEPLGSYITVDDSGVHPHFFPSLKTPVLQ